MENANGVICGFLDPDDALVNDALEVMVKEHVNRSDVGLVYSKYFLVDNTMTVGADTNQIPCWINCYFIANIGERFDVMNLDKIPTCFPVK